MEFKKIGIASDHAGVELKKMIIEFASLLGVEVIDYGVSTEEQKSVDYPDYAKLIAENISSGKLEGGIAICGTGIGMSITGNKFPGVRATVVWSEFSCRVARSHNNSNLLCLGGRTLNYHRAVEYVKIWLETPFDGERHSIRLEKIKNIEKSLVNSK